MFNLNLHAFGHLLIFFRNQCFQKIPLGILSVSNHFDPDQSQNFVSLDLGPKLFHHLIIR